ncbi:hypothetical protein [Pseudooceanicola sp. LIPI14-2-Ac024]
MGLTEGATLDEAFEAAVTGAGSFDPGPVLALLIEDNCITAVEVRP